MKVGFEIKGLKSLQKKLDKFKAEALGAQVRAVQKGTLLIHEIAVKSIQDNSGGSPSIRYNPTRVVNVSKPFDPPNTDTGRLVQSVKFDFQNAGLVGRVGTNLRYGAYLEFGTENMAPRPWLLPAVEKASKSIGEIFAKEISDTISGVGQ